MQLKFLCVLCLALCAHVSAVRELRGMPSRELRQNQGINATTKASSTASSTASGAVAITRSRSSGNSTGGASATASTSQASVTSRSTSFSTATAESDFKVAIANAVAEVESGDGDAIALAEAAAASFAVAIAEAYAETSVEILSTFEDATICGQAFAEADSSATASARVLVNVLAEASNKISFVDSEATIDAIQDVTVRAFTAAKSSACVNGVGQARAATSQLSQAIGVAFAKVSALALAVVTPGANETEIVVEANADRLVVKTVDGRTATDVVGIAEANANTTGGANGERR